jgi:hypothetical protein
MSKIKYWSLGCDILGGPKDRAVKIATAQMPEIAKDIADAMNATGQEANDLRATLDTERELRTLGDTYARRVADWIVGIGDGWPLAGPFLEIRECIEGTRRQLDKQIAAHCSNKALAENRAKVIEQLRSALAGLIGAETKEELEAMEAAMRIMPGIEADKIAGISAIHALLSCEP